MDKFKDLNDTFDIDEVVEPEVLKPEPVKDVEKPVPVSKNKDKDIEKDYEYTRGNLYSIIEKGQEALDSALEIAVDQGQARAFEVVGQLIKSVADTTDKLVDLQKKIKEIEEDNPKGPTNVTNAMFFGSTAELSKLLKKNKAEEKDK
jgi:hypothetical protein|tara:strand:- start:1339 stop:1779 length:441 start_codon:yes stop_codon:yes gene_type:complete